MLVLKALGGFLLFTWVLLIYAAPVVGPLALLLFLLRRRLPRLVPRIVLALAMPAATAYWMYRMEWFDVWRHGFPGVRYLLETHGPLAVVFAALGWLGGALIAPKRKTPRGVVRAGSCRGPRA